MAERPLILVIDDLAQNVEVIGECLSDLYDIQCAFSGAESLRLVTETLPDLILLDVMMPVMDGYDVCKALLNDARTRDVPIIFITAKSDTESETRALAAGAVDFIHKPVNREVVRARVRLHLDLKARDRELRNLNAELEKRVEERTQALQDALIRAEIAFHAKSRFLSNINHELRTPMNAILGLSELLARQVGDARLSARVDRIIEAGRKLLGIVTDIIDMADLQADKIQLDVIDFTLTSVLGEIDRTWRGPAEAKGLTLVREEAPTVPQTLRGDPARLSQILGNFLSNAIKFSERGRITLRANLIDAHKDDLKIRFEVQDEGIGIEASRKGAIFDIFEQADNSNTRRYGGIGLGLAICKQLAQLMGGSIGVDSMLETGSLFWVVLRFKRVDSPVPVQATVVERRQSPDDSGAGTALDVEYAKHVVIPLVGMLATGNVEAYFVWDRARPLLDDLLGERADDFNLAMETFEFAVALGHLLAARAACPQLNED